MYGMDGLKALSLLKVFSKLESRPVLAWPPYPPGLPLGAITQVRGQGKTLAFLQLLASHPGLKAAWVEERISAYPPAFVQQGVDLNFLLFVQGGKDLHWALVQLLRSQIFKVLAVASPLKDEVQLKRLQLAAERSGTALLVLADIEGPAWPVKLRLHAGVHDGVLCLRQKEEGIAMKEAR